MTEISMGRLNALRLGYLILGGGLILTIWPAMFNQPPGWPVPNSIVTAMLCGLSLMALLGLRYPMRMLPILLFEFTWKVIWVGFVAVPRWLSESLDDRTVTTLIEVAVVVIIVPLIPWRHVLDRYVLSPGTPWRRGAGDMEDPARA